jgi:hypothetical protein
MKTTKRTISSSAKTSPAYLQMLADKQAMRNHFASLTPVAGLFSNDSEGIQSVSVR